MVTPEKAYEIEDRVNELHSAIFDIDSAISTVKPFDKGVAEELLGIRYRLNEDKERLQEQLDEYERYELYMDKQRSYHE